MISQLKRILVEYLCYVIFVVVVCYITNDEAPLKMRYWNDVARLYRHAAWVFGQKAIQAEARYYAERDRHYG